MLFTQLSFLFLFVCAWSGHWLIERNHFRKLWLLGVSYFFYGYWDYRFLVLIGFFTVLNQGAAQILDRASAEARRKVILRAAIAGNLMVLGFFKYFNFFVHEVGAVLGRLGWETSSPGLEIILPVGISFITFQSMSYTIDVYRRDVSPRGLLDVSLFIAFFPQLVAGPIVRATDLLGQFETKRTFSEIHLRWASGLFLVGYFKKACVADNIAAAIDPIFSSPEGFDGMSRVLGAILYSVQIYCDFSGYTDMAIAVSALFGYRLIKNFDAPYLSSNIRQFWQRWHISLSSWLRDYLYIPLGGNRGGSFYVARNLMLTMVLGGLWHGANWTFLLWGFLHGAALIAQRSFSQHRPSISASFSASTLLSWFVTFSWVVLCFTIFRAADISIAWRYLTEASTDGLQVWPGWWLIVGTLSLLHYLIHAHRDGAVTYLRAIPTVPYCLGWGAVAAVALYLVRITRPTHAFETVGYA